MLIAAQLGGDPRIVVGSLDVELSTRVGFSLAKRTTICTVRAGMLGRPEGFG